MGVGREDLGVLVGEEDEISGDGGRWRRIPRVNYSGKEELETNTLHLICKAVKKKRCT